MSLNKFEKETRVILHFVDIYNPQEKYCTELLATCATLCDIFDIEIEKSEIREQIDNVFHLTVTLFLEADHLGHKMNVIKSFAQEYQINIASCGVTYTTSYS